MKSSSAERESKEEKSEDSEPHTPMYEIFNHGSRIYMDGFQGLESLLLCRMLDVENF